MPMAKEVADLPPWAPERRVVSFVQIVEETYPTSPQPIKKLVVASSLDHKSPREEVAITISVLDQYIRYLEASLNLSAPVVVAHYEGAGVWEPFVPPGTVVLGSSEVARAIVEREV